MLALTLVAGCPARSARWATSVLGRALQRGIGTIVGAVAGAVLLALVHGTWLLIPFAVLASLLPYGRKRNYGLMTTFLTPLAVVLTDLLSPAGCRISWAGLTNPRSE